MDFRGSDFYRSRLAKVGFVWEMRAKLRHFLNFQVELRSFARKVFAAEKQMIESQKLGKGNCPKWLEQVGKNAAPQQLVCCAAQREIHSKSIRHPFPTIPYNPQSFPLKSIRNPFQTHSRPFPMLPIHFPKIHSKSIRNPFPTIPHAPQSFPSSFPLKYARNRRNR